MSIIGAGMGDWTHIVAGQLYCYIRLPVDSVDCMVFSLHRSPELLATPVLGGTECYWM